jgi:hypothetical protein
MKRSLCIFILVLLPLSIVRADTTACIFDWAETAAPSLISSSVKTQNIPYGDFTLRYYDKTKNALIVQNDSKKLYFYNVAKYLAGDAELEIFAETKTGVINFDIRAYQSGPSDSNNAVLDILIDGELINSVTVDFSPSSESFPAWSRDSNVNFSFDYSKAGFKNISLRSKSGGLLEASNVQFLGEEILPSEDNLKNKFGESSSLNWVGSGKFTSYIIPNQNSNISEVGDVHYWALVSDCVDVKEPIPVEATSYLEAHSDQKLPIKLPDLTGKGWQPHSWEQADFLQNGSQTLVAGTLAKSAFDLSYYDEDKTGEFYFFSRETLEDDWVDITDLLLSDNTGCVIPRKTIVSDFNNDGRPDVVFACHGLDFSLEVLTEEGLQRGEASRILLSKSDGTYENKVLSHDGKYENCFCHGGAAGDIDNDGNIDILLSDSFSTDPAFEEFRKWDGNVGQLHILLGDGNGNFKLKTDLPESLLDCCYYSSDLYDFNGDGYLDIWASGGAPHGTYQERNIIAYSREGQFFEEDIVDLPTDGKHTFSGDFIVNDGYVYLGGINIDFSKASYYWGYAITKIPIDGSSYEVIYEHEGWYDDVCDPNGGTDSWIKWLIIEDGNIVPKQDCAGHNFKVPL